MQKIQPLKSRTDSYFKLLDYWLIIPVLILTIIGLYVLNSVYQTGYGAGEYPGNLIKQIGAVMIGVLLALLISFVDLPVLSLVGYITYALSIFLLVLVHIDSFSMEELTGADSWIRFPIFGTFQPSELAKVGIAMLVGKYLAKIKNEEIPMLTGSIYIGVIVSIPLLLIAMEPDFGTFFVIFLMVLVMIFVFGLKWRYIITGGAVGIVALPLAWQFYLDEYQKNRIMTFLFPGHDPNSNYHIEQSLKAVASGGITGRGSGVDIPVPVKESDFIFSAISEYTGFIGTTLVLILIVIFLFRAIQIAIRMSEYDLASSYLMMGLVAVQGFHFIENIGMNVGVLPITGIPLPFISSGGSSMVVNYFMFGLMLSISINYQLMEQSDL
ncbi:MAG: FtsW/RodA/SpoVE family cell cycle protein [Clostridiaceae bacterium]|nr:FtsW/RodA/SpoVE family cell cycle protein [Bacillota bacterium]NLN52305.1 FtsW/RodA/SpoVE family cell cycle protein [Clostridiaceae bacterium]